MPRREWILRRHWSEHLRSLPNLDLGQIGKQLAVRRRRQRKRQLLPTLPMLSFTLLWFQVVAHAYIAGVGPRCWSVQPLRGWSDAQKGYAISLVISWKMQTFISVVPQAASRVLPILAPVATRNTFKWDLGTLRAYLQGYAFDAWIPESKQE